MGIRVPRPEESALPAGAWDEPGKPEIIYEKVLQDARRALAADVCTLFPLNPVTGDFAAAPRVLGPLRDASLSSVSPPRPGGLTRKILDRKQVFVETLATEPDWKSPFTDAEGIVAFAGIALQAQERLKPLAVLYLDYRQPQAFDESYQQRLHSFSEQASSFLQTSWLLSRYRKVIDLGQEINQDLDTYENLFTKLDRHTRELLDTSYFFLLGVYFAQTDSMDRFCLLYRQPKQEMLRPLPIGCRAVLSDRRPILIERASGLAENTPFIEELRNDLPDIESLVVAPLSLRETPLGVLAVAHRRDRAYDQEDLHILQLLANHVAAALSNIHLFADLDQISKIGQSLTERLEGEDVLQSVVDRIREATLADLVILYPYHGTEGRFELLPRISGECRQPDFQQPVVCQEGDIPYLTAALDGPLFLEDAAELPGKLGSVPQRLGNFQQREGVVSLVAMPLRVGGETVGALYANFRSRQLFSGSQKRLHNGLSVFAAIAIKNAWQFGRRGRELAVLGRIDSKLKRSLRDSLNLDSVLTTILEEADEILQAEHSAILLMDPSKRQLRFAAWFGGPPIVEGYGITRWVYEHRETVHVDDVRTDPKWKDLYFEAFSGTRSELDTPLLDESEHAIGVLSFESPRRGAFDSEQKQFVETLAGQVVMAIQKAQAYETAERRAHDRQILFDISRQIASQLELEKLLAFILEKAIDTTRAAAGVLLLYDANSGDLVIRAEKGLDENYGRGVRLTLDKGIVGRVAREQRLRNIDPSDPEWRDIYLRCARGTRSLLAVPLLAGERLWGVLDVESPEPDHFPARAERLVEALADMAVVALQHAERYESAEEGRQRLEALWDAGNQLAKLSENSQRGEACRIVAHVASERRKCRSVVRIYDPKQEEFVLVAVQGSQGQDSPFERMKVTEGISGLVYRTRRTQLIADVDKLPPGMPRPKLTDPLKRSLLVAPILLGDDFYGTLSLSHRQPHFFHDPADKTLADGLASLLAITFHRFEGIQRQRDLQERARQAEVISWIGDASYGFAHRLSGDLGYIPSHVNNAEDALERRKFSDSVVEENMAAIKRKTKKVLDLSDKLKREVQSFRLEDPAIVPIPAVLAEIKELFRDLPPAQRLVIDLEEGLGSARAVRRHVVDILRNLVTNGLEAIPKGGKVTIRGRNDGPTLRIEVEDTGEGIPEEHLDKIFSFLYSTKGGSGFGLWSALRKAQANAGGLTVQSPPGRGAIFILTLPLAESKVEVEFGSKG